MEPKPDKLRPALLGGLIIGIISATPVISLINCFCCAGVIAGGILAVNWYKKSLGSHELNYSDGIITGLMAGASGALISTIIQAAIGPNTNEVIDQLIESYPDIPPELEELLLKIQSIQGDLIFIVIELFIALFIYSLFGILGGIIAVSLFKKNKPKTMPPYVEQL
ncbi:MAG: hypothetical protein ACOY90_17585 [Candidatus Zhuqueibacterota bacterium]